MTSTHSLPARGAHMPVLDGIRGLAILLVMIQHFLHGIDKGGFFGDDVVFAMAGRCWMGVDLFFVLSGFLITGILWDAKGQQGYFKNFYARRVLRIFPAYYAVLIVLYVVLPLITHPGVQSYVAASIADQAWHWSYLSNFKIGLQASWYETNIPNVFWSLAIEEQFYMAWPIVVLLLSKRGVVLACAGLFALAIGLRMYAAAIGVNWVTSFVLTPTRLDGLVLGACLALVARSRVDIRKSRRIALIAALVCFLPFAWLETQRGPNWRLDLTQTTRFALIAILFGALLWLAVTGDVRGWLQRIFTLRPMRVLGKYSYALYLWHGPVDDVARHYLQPNSFGTIFGSKLPITALSFAISFSLSMLVAWLSWNVMEKHCLKLKRLFHNKPPTDAAATPVVVGEEALGQGKPGAKRKSG